MPSGPQTPEILEIGPIFLGSDRAGWPADERTSSRGARHDTSSFQLMKSPEIPGRFTGMLVGR